MSDATAMKNSQGQQQEPKEGAGELTKQLVFTIGEQLYATPLDGITEVIEPLGPTKAPKAPPHVMGVINLRGEIITAIDLRHIFNQKIEEAADAFMIVVPTSKGKVAALVDKMQEVRDFAPDDISESVSIDSYVPHDCLYGVGKLNNEVFFSIDLKKLVEKVS